MSIIDKIILYLQLFNLIEKITTIFLFNNAQSFGNMSITD